MVVGDLSNQSKAVHDQDAVGERDHFRHVARDEENRGALAGDLADELMQVGLGLDVDADAEIAQYRSYWPCGMQQRLVMEFALEALSRRGEVVRLGPQHVYTGLEGETRIRIARIHASEDVDIRVTPDLEAAIDAMPRTHLTFIVTAYGKPRSKFGLGTDFAQWAREAGLPDHCRLHGLKKAGMRRGAEDGNTAHELMAQSGHKTLVEVQRYTHGADQKRLADQGMAKRRGAQSGNSQVTNLAARSYNPTTLSLPIEK